MEGELGVGSDFKIEYSGARLPGEPRMIHAEFKFSEHGAVHSERLNEESDGKLFTETIFLPYDAKALIIWFKQGDKYDSDFGKNYHFAITKPSIVFDSVYEETVHGALKAGGKFDVWYDSARLGGDKNITLQVKFAEDGDVSSKLLTTLNQATSYLHRVVDIPNDAKSVIMWFFKVVNGKKEYDSNYSQNYHFNLMHE